MTDYYTTLGVQRGASLDEIKKAYRKLASEHHPDKGGNTEKFQEIQAAYSVLGDQEKKTRYDSPQTGPNGFHFEFNSPNGFDFNNIFNMFGAQFHQQAHAPNQRQTSRMTLWVSLVDVARGGSKPVTVGNQYGNRTLELEIPLGINDGEHVQYRGIGPEGTDLIVQFRIHQDAKWQRNDLNLTVEQSLTVWDCIVGNNIEVQDILGNKLMLTIPPTTQPDAVLRIKEKGLRNKQGVGDLFIKLKAKIPKHVDLDLIKLIKEKIQP